MSTVIWSPESSRPADAAVLEAKIAAVAPGAQVQLTLVDGEWRVRALGSAAMCERGGDFSTRDRSAAVAEMLSDEGLPASVFRSGR
jgi:hypothetical protein